MGISFSALQHCVAGSTSTMVYDFHGQGALEKYAISQSPILNINKSMFDYLSG